MTQRKYDMVDANALKNLQGIKDGVHAVSGVITDPVAEIAAVVGADIYVTFTWGLTQNVKASASVKAYETTTAKLLASATGESRLYPSGTPPMDAIREAASDGIPKLFEDISGYWHEDAAKGKKYVFSIAGNFSDREKSKAIRKALQEIGEVKFSSKTASKIDGVLRSKKGPDDVEDAIDDAIKEAGFSKSKLTLSNRALFVFSVE
jgi:hypothetical protein